ASNAATALYGANLLCGEPATRDELVAWAHEALGTEVAAFLGGTGRSFCAGRGVFLRSERAEPLPPPRLEPPPPFLGSSGAGAGAGSGAGADADASALRALASAGRPLLATFCRVVLCLQFCLAWAQQVAVVVLRRPLPLTTPRALREASDATAGSAARAASASAAGAA
ncbi:MAG: hypothetical protein VXW43_19960, partial [Pseudomonadota bacterium]|nr:hypothetical protein [Pseudomonadota bacterium]